MAQATQWLAMILAVAGVVANNHRRMMCFSLWIVSNAICAWLHAKANLWGLVARDVIFSVLAVHGWVLWRRMEAGRGKKR